MDDDEMTFIVILLLLLSRWSDGHCLLLLRHTIVFIIIITDAPHIISCQCIRLLSSLAPPTYITNIHYNIRQQYLCYLLLFGMTYYHYFHYCRQDILLLEHTLLLLYIWSSSLQQRRCRLVLRAEHCHHHHYVTRHGHCFASSRWPRLFTILAIGCCRTRHRFPSPLSSRFIHMPPLFIYNTLLSRQPSFVKFILPHTNMVYALPPTYFAHHFPSWFSLIYHWLSAIAIYILYRWLFFRRHTCREYGGEILYYHALRCRRAMRLNICRRHLAMALPPFMHWATCQR